MVTFHVSAIEVSRLLVNEQECSNCTVPSTSPLIVDQAEINPELVVKQDIFIPKFQKRNENNITMIQQKGLESCTDDSEYLYQDKEKQNCKWISFKKNKDVLCDKKKVKQKCKKSCGIGFPVGNKCRKCGYISSKNWKKVCKQNYVFENCKECCDLQKIDEALVALYDSTGGGAWKKSDGWGSDADPCTWHGITCVTDLISIIDLADNNLQGTIPPELFCLNKLEKLSMSDNILKSTIPSNIGNLAELKELSLGVNDLTGQIPPLLMILDKLEDVRLAHNQFTGHIPLNYKTQLGLQYIDISDAQLDGMIPSEIGELKSLRHLSLENNKLSGTVPLELGDVTKLTILNIGNNNLKGNVPQSIFELPDLEILDFSTNELIGHLPKALNRKTKETGKDGIIVQNNLQYIQLYDNQITGMIPTEMGNLDKLKTLSLSSNQLSGNIPTELGKLNNIIELFLNDNSLTGIVPLEVCELKIEFLNTDYNANLKKCEPEKCEDDIKKEFTIGGVKKLCHDILDVGERVQFCHLTVVHTTCPYSCGTCCTSNKEYTFQDAYYEYKNCEFIDNLAKQKKFCQEGSETYKQCGEECGCPDYSEMTPKPSSMPTTATPTIVPTTSPSYALMKEYEVLMELYYATKGPIWDESLYWGVKDNPCVWNRVTCNDDDKVIMIHLDKNNLIGTIPSNIWMLTELKELKLADNAIKGTIPSQIGMMKSLEWVDVYGNGIKGKIPTEVAMMNSLKHWQSFENDMDDDIPDGICLLPDLQRFYHEREVNEKLDCDDF